MRKFFTLFMFVVTSAIAPSISAEEMDHEILHRVFMIRCGKEWGSSFPVTVEGQQYMITARHVVAEIEKGKPVDFWLEKKWVAIPVVPIYCESPTSDIVALLLEREFTTSMPLEVGGDGFYVAQELLFLGYPYGLAGMQKDHPPMPFVKRAMLSAMDSRNDCDKVLFIDGHNNPGFSGGPVLYRDEDSGEFVIGGVVSGFGTEPVKVQRKRLTDQGEEVMVETEDLYFKRNTEILVAHVIDHILDAIRENPTGGQVEGQ